MFKPSQDIHATMEQSRYNRLGLAIVVGVEVSG